MGNDEDMKYSVWLQLCLGAASSNFKRAIEVFKNAENIYGAGFKALKDSGIFSAGELRRLSTVQLVDAEKIINDCYKNKIGIITYSDKRYPVCLSAIDNPPAVIYYKGKFPDFDNIPSVAIVGPRNVSEFGKRAAFSLGYRLARSGMIVVSGGALGCDTHAHAGALKAEGITVLVMACGILSNYLKENAPLRNEVAKNGCLISEYLPDFPATRYTFPVRNRIISALSLGTVVIEAGEKSGALITARHANDQGRDVFVIPHSPKNKSYEGSNALLRDGAKPLIDASDIFNEYIPRFPDKINIERAYSGHILSDTVKNEAKSETKNQKSEKNLNETLSKEAKIVYNYLDKQKFLPEDLLGCGLSSQQLLSALTELEMEFLIKAVPGGMYEKC